MRNINLTSKIKLFTGLGILALSSLIVYAAMPPVATILGDGTNASVPLFDGEPARVTARHLVTPAFDVGGWHYHPGYVHNVVIQGTIRSRTAAAMLRLIVPDRHLRPQRGACTEPSTRDLWTR